MKKLVHFFVTRPLLINLLMVLFIISGVLGLRHMNIESLPAIDMGKMKITTLRPGAGPNDIELTITIPIEKELLKVDGISKILSKNMESLSIISITMDSDIADTRQIEADIQKAVDRAASKLPQDLPQKPLVERLSTTSVPVVEIYVTGDVFEEELRFVAQKLSDGLREIEGIGGVLKIGYRDREVRILLDPLLMEHLHVTFDEITAAIKRHNVRDSGGSLESFATEKKVLTVGQFSHPKDVENVIVRAQGAGNYVRIRDLGEVIFDYEKKQTITRVDGESGIALMPTKKKEADSVATTRAVQKYVAEFIPTLPPGIKITVVNDTTRFTLNMLEILISNGIIGFILVFLVLLFFFNLQLAFWVSVGIPVAMLFTFALMPFFDLAINTLTLTAIILMLGMLVDDAIVTSESIYGFKEKNMNPIEASVQGVERVMVPVFASSITTILAFTPIAFLGGLEGKLMWAFPVMAALILGSSLFECKFMLSCHLAHGKDKPPSSKKWVFWLQNIYRVALYYMLKVRYLTILLFILGFIAIVDYGSKTLRFDLYPDEDIDTVFLKIELLDARSLSYTSEKVKELELLARNAVAKGDLLNITTRIGDHDNNPVEASEGKNSAWALITILMRPQEERTTNSNAVVKELGEKIKGLSGYKNIIIEPLRSAPVSGKPVEIEVIGNGKGRFELTEKLLEYLRNYPGAKGVDSSYKPGKDVLQLKLNYEVMADRGLTVTDVTNAVRIAFDGKIVDELQTVDETIKYRLQLRNSNEKKMDVLKNLTIINDRFLPVPLRSFVEIQLEPGETSIKHYLGKRTITIYADIDRKKTSVQKINSDIEAFVKEEKLLQRFPKMRLFYGGELDQQKKAMGGIGTAFVMCFSLIFFVLVIIFNSLTQPLLILILIPFSLTGVIVGFSLQDIPLSMMALMGVLGLVGVLVNDSVVMITVLNYYRQKKGTNVRLESADIADSAKERLRPIIITSITSVAGLFPTAYGFLGSNPFVVPMVMSMAWGLVFGTLLSLFFLPCLYAMDQDIRRMKKVRPEDLSSEPLLTRKFTKPT